MDDHKNVPLKQRRLSVLQLGSGIFWLLLIPGKGLALQLANVLL
jgi:hypothetical protein